MYRPKIEEWEKLPESMKKEAGGERMEEMGKKEDLSKSKMETMRGEKAQEKKIPGSKKEKLKSSKIEEKEGSKLEEQQPSNPIEIGLKNIETKIFEFVGYVTKDYPKSESGTLQAKESEKRGLPSKKESASDRWSIDEQYAGSSMKEEDVEQSPSKEDETTMEMVQHKIADTISAAKDMITEPITAAKEYITGAYSKKEGSEEVEEAQPKEDETTLEMV